EAAEPLPVAEHREVLVAQGATALLDDLANLVSLRGGGESHSGPQHLVDGAVAARAAEDEEDRGQEILGIQEFHEPGAIHPPALTCLSRVIAAELALPPPAHRPPVRGRQSNEFWVDPGQCRRCCAGLAGCRRRASAEFGRSIEQVEELAAYEHVLLERHRTLFGDDHGRLA